ncbi:hypothetical protein CRG98_014570 [Punica granatum]|uniref:AIG1-type G domain-containing protein n=1 Tax=Punica granatum TaxID=22663 RepID=A0A2I0K984_PUNGR|nr:hypothetical protein CRG98_014570 [Punica granatum]
MELKPRSFLFSTTSSPSSSGSLPIRAPLTVDDGEEEEDYDPEPNIPRIRLSSINGASSCSDISDIASERSFVADPAEEAEQVYVESPKDWIFRPFVASPGGSSDGQEDVLLELEGLGRVRTVPIARESAEFDDEEEELRVVEDEEDGFVARVPGFVVRDDYEGRAERNALQLKIISPGDDWVRNEVLKVNVGEDLSAKDATVSSVDDCEMSDSSNGITDGISGGENGSSTEMKPCDDDQKRSELLEVCVSEDLSVIGTMESHVSDDEVSESNGVCYGISGRENILSLETNSHREDRSALLGMDVAGNASLKDDAIDTCAEKGNFESLRFAGVESLGPRSGLVSIGVVVPPDSDAKENPSMENVELSSISSDFIDCVVSNAHPEPKETTEDQRCSVSDLEPENPILDSVKLINILKDASVSWGSSIAADIEKIVVCDRHSDGDEDDGKGKQAFGWESERNLVTEERCDIGKIELLREKFLRLLNFLGCSPKDSIAAHVLHQFALVLEDAPTLGFTKEMGVQSESGGGNNLDSDFSLNILVFGKPGVGKSSTINTFLGEQRSPVDPLQPATTSMKEILETVNGVKVRILDTPGLRVSVTEQALNRKMLSAVKKYTKKFPPNIVLYVDRLDSLGRDFNDQPLLQTITRMFGSSIWKKALVTLTHAASLTSPDGPYNTPLSCEAFARRRSGKMLCCIENNCRQEVLPNGQKWRKQLLLFGCSVKVMAEISSRLRPRDSFQPWELFGVLEYDSEMNTGNSEHACVPGNNVIPDVLVDSSAYTKHGEHRLNLLQLEIQHLGKIISSNLEGETGPLKSLRIPATEDQNVDLEINDQVRATPRNCLVPSRADLKASMDFPVGDNRCPLVFSLMEIGGDSTLRANLQSQFSLGRRHPTLEVFVRLKEERRWKITLRAGSSESLLVSLFGLLPIVVPVFQFFLRRQG